tara:strand:+ start:801 stop:2279 length:1479 start_codon:yes stop_codon:yes gene_type:complete
MGRSLTQTASTGSGGGLSHHPEDPYTQPCFSVWSMEYGDGGGGFFMYDHNFNSISKFRGDGNQAYSNYRTYSSSASEFMQNYHGWQGWQTTSHMNSNSERSSGTQTVGYLGHTHFTPPGKNSSSGGWVRQANNGYEYAGRAFRDVNVIVNETHQDYAFFTKHEGGSQRNCLMPRSANLYWNAEQYSMHSRFTTNCQWSQGMYGSACYNPKTKKVCFMETNTSYTFRPVVYSNVPDMRAYAHNSCYQDEADSYSDKSWNDNVLTTFYNSSSNRTLYAQSQSKPSNQTSEDNYRCITVLCDNDKVVMFQMIPSYGAWTHRWDSSGNSEGRIWYSSWTTSYGHEQGSRYGARWQVSSDGRYIFAYCAAYYYGSGLYFTAIRVSDGKCIHGVHTDSSYGYPIVPVGKSNFCMFPTYNTDGAPGVYYCLMDMDRWFHDYTDNTTLSPWNWQSSWMIDGAYHSTSYPGIVPCRYDTSLFNNALPNHTTNPTIPYEGHE